MIISPTSGAAIFLALTLVSWWFHRQTVVARSYTEAEYRSLASATTEPLWIQTLLSELAIPHCVPVVYCENLSADNLCHNLILHAKTKHIELDIFFVREIALAKQQIVKHVPGHEQWANILTKPLSRTIFLFLSSKRIEVDLQVVSHPP